MTDKTQFYTQRLESLRSRRGHWDTQWEESAARVIPAHRDSFLSQGANNAFGMGGEKKTELQYDSTAAIACQRFASVIESLSTPQSGIWHRLTPADKTLKRNRRVRLFFDELNEVLFSYRYRPVANFVGQSQQVYLGLGAYGNGALFIDQPERTRGLRYRNIHIGEAYFVENHAGIVDTLYRAFYLTARQIVQEYGDAASDQVKAMAANAMQAETKFEILHCVHPREDYNPQRVDSLGKQFASIHMEVSSKTWLREGGFDVFPYGVTRYSQASGEEYGRGPAQWVLPAIKVLNDEKKTMLVQGHRTVDPILLYHDDGVLGGNFKVRAGKSIAGGVNADGKLLVQTLPVGNIAAGEDLMEMERRVINDAFLITLFQILVDTPAMTATEVLERAREKGMLVAPTAGRLQAEFLGPMIERELQLLASQGLLPEMPPILRDSPEAMEYKIEYDSPMSRMQRAEKASGFMRALDVAANYAKNTQDISPLDWFNFDNAMPEILDIHGAPTSWTRSLEEVLAAREQRAEQLQQQQMVEAAPAIAGMMKNNPGMAKPQE